MRSVTVGFFFFFESSFWSTEAVVIIVSKSNGTSPIQSSLLCGGRFIEQDPGH